MKKLFALFLAIIMLFSLAACGGGNDDKTPSSDDTTPSSSPQQEQNTPDPAPVEDKPDSSEDENSGKETQTDAPVPTTGLPLDWPDNDYTKLVPAPDCGGKVLTSGEIGELFAIELKWSMEQGLTYAQLLQDAGFGEDCVEKYEKQGYLDRTANGVNVQLMDVFGTTSISIMPAPDSDIQQGGDPIDLSGYLNTKTGKFYSQFADGRMYMEYEMEMEGQVMSMISATSGDKTYSETKMGGASMGVSIMIGEDMYTIDHASKMVIKMGLQADAQTIAGTVLEESDVDMGDLKAGTREIDGKTYDTEEWIVEGTASIMCFDGDELAYMIGAFEGEEMIMKIVEVSDKVDDSLFEIPADYTMMEM